jgi:hypothetical protein
MTRCFALVLAAVCLSVQPGNANIAGAWPPAERTDSIVGRHVVRIAAMVNPYAVRRYHRPRAGQERWLNPQPEPPMRPGHPNWLNPQPEPPMDNRPYWSNPQP